MSIRKVPVVLTCLLLLAVTAEHVSAQTEVAPRRGSLKVRARYFNPFAPFTLSRYTIDRFGFPQVMPLGPAATGPATSGAFLSPEADIDSPVSSSQSVSSSAATEEEASAEEDEDAPVASSTSMSGRPWYRPPVRSPYRPPPRPPF